MFGNVFFLLSYSERPTLYTFVVVFVVVVVVFVVVVVVFVVVVVVDVVVVVVELFPTYA